MASDAAQPALSAEALKLEIGKNIACSGFFFAAWGSTRVPQPNDFGETSGLFMLKAMALAGLDTSVNYWIPPGETSDDPEVTRGNPIYTDRSGRRLAARAHFQTVLAEAEAEDFPGLQKLEADCRALLEAPE